MKNFYILLKGIPEEVLKDWGYEANGLGLAIDLNKLKSVRSEAIKVEKSIEYFNTKSLYNNMKAVKSKLTYEDVLVSYIITAVHREVFIEGGAENRYILWQACYDLMEETGVNELTYDHRSEEHETRRINDDDFLSGAEVAKPISEEVA